MSTAAPTISTSCPRCKTTYKVSAVHLGKRTRCTKCGEPFAVSSASLPGAEWRVGDVLLDLYEVKSVLGQGGFGKVYRLYHRGWGMDLAVKTPNAAALERAGGTAAFELESETWVQLGLHPHTVSCYYVRRIEAIPRVFVEYLPGGDLHTWIARGKLYAGDRALARMLDIAIQFAWGLHHAHEQGLIHQDVKPANVMMSADGVAKVTDFGLANAGHIEAADLPGEEGDTLIVDGVGRTPQYAAPEQMAGRRLTRRSDIWGWATSVLEMFQGERTWQMGTVAGHHLESLLATGPTRARVPRMPESLGSLLAECFREEESERPHDLGLVADRLMEIYRQALDTPYRRLPPRASEGMADSRNNRAISLLDLGRRKEAYEAWAGALRTEAHHLESTYNRGLDAWRSLEIADATLIKQLEEARAAAPSAIDAACLLCQAHLERGDCESALEALRSVAAHADHHPDLERLESLAGESLPLSRGCRQQGEHGAAAFCVSLSGDGRIALSGGNDGEIRIWDAASGECVGTLQGHQGPVVGVSVGARGTRAASADGNGRLNLWNLESGAVEHTIEGRMGTSSCVFMSAAGPRFMSGGNDLTPRVWEAPRKQAVQSFPGHRDGIAAVWLSPDGRYGVSGALDGIIKVWRVEDGACVRTLRAHRGGVGALAGTRGAQFILSGGADGTLEIWSTAKGERARTLTPHEEAVTAIAVSPDGRVGASGAKDGSVRFWDLESGRCECTFSAHEGPVSGLGLSADGARAASSGHDRAIKFWAVKKRYGYTAPFALSRVRSSEDLATTQGEYERQLGTAREALGRGDYHAALRSTLSARALPGFERHQDVMAVWRELCGYFPHPTLRSAWERARLLAHSRTVRCVEISADGSLAVSGGDDRALELWDVVESQRAGTLLGHEAPVNAVSISPDGGLVLSAAEDGVLSLWESRSAACIASVRAHAAPVIALAASFDWRFALTASADRTLRLFEIDPLRALRTFTAHTRAPNACALSPDARHAISAGDDRTVKFWDLASGECIASAGAFGGHSRPITSLAVSPDASFVVTASLDGTLRTWSMGGDRCLQTLSAGASPVLSVALSQDGQYALSAQEDGSLVLWDIARGEQVYALDAHKGAAHAVCFGHNRSVALSGGDEGAVKLWTLDWDIEEASSPADWRMMLESYLRIFLEQRVPSAVRLPREGEPTEREVTEALTRRGRPRWTEEAFLALHTALRRTGWGWIHPEQLRAELRRLSGGDVTVQRARSPRREEEPPRAPEPAVPAVRSSPAEALRRPNLALLIGALALAVAAVWLGPSIGHAIGERRELSHAREQVEGGIGVDRADAEGNTLLHLAAQKGHAEVARYLIANGADVHARNQQQWMPIHFAASHGYPDVVKALADAGSSIVAEAGASFLTPARLADAGGHEDVLAVLEQVSKDRGN